MKETPLLFKGAMVRAIIDGTKWQTRRMIKGVPYHLHCGRPLINWALSDIYQAADDLDLGKYSSTKGSFYMDVQTEVDDNSHTEIFCPFGTIQDRLWGKETFAPHPGHERVRIAYKSDMRSYGLNGGFAYPSEEAPEQGLVFGDPILTEKPWGKNWKPSIFMPRWASRINLEITNVRVERIADISEEDAKAEGVEPLDSNAHESRTQDDFDKGLCQRCGGLRLHDSFGPDLGVIPDTDCLECDTHAKRFRWLWDSINGQPSPVYGKDKKITHYVSFPFSGEPRTEKHRGKDHIITPNPWVWCLTFKKV